MDTLPRRAAGKRGLMWLLMCLACLFFSQAGIAATWLDSIFLTFDTPLQSGAGVLLRQQVLKQQYATAPQILSPGLSANVGIAALTLNGSNLLYTPDISFTLNGALVTPRDVVSYTGSSSSIYMHGSAHGLPANVRIDALALLGSNVLFSLDTKAKIGSTQVGPADVLQWNGTAVSVLYGAQALGLASNTNLTALEKLPNGHLLMGFDIAGKVGGVTYRAGEILEYAPGTSSWVLVRNQAQLGVTCSPCRTRDIAVVGNIDEIFKNGFELNEEQGL